MESIKKLKPVFSSSGVVTAGNSSQISDGAAAVLLASGHTYNTCVFFVCLLAFFLQCKKSIIFLLLFCMHVYGRFRCMCVCGVCVLLCLLHFETKFNKKKQKKTHKKKTL